MQTTASSWNSMSTELIWEPSALARTPTFLIYTWGVKSPDIYRADIIVNKWHGLNCCIGSTGIGAVGPTTEKSKV